MDASTARVTSLASLEGAAEAAGQAILLVDETGRCVHGTSAAATLLGVDHRALPGHPVDAGLDDAALARLGHARTLLASGRSPTVDYAFRRGDGTMAAVRATLAPASAGGHWRFLLDQTESRRAAEVNDRFFELTVDLLVEATPDGYFTRLNPAWERTLGWTREQLTTTRFIDFVHPDDRERTIAEAARLGTEGTECVSFENRWRHRDGGWRFLLWNAYGAAGGRIYATARDVTQRRRVHEALRESEERYRGLYESSLDALGLLDADGRLVACNPAFLILAARTRDDAMGMRFAELVPARLDDGRTEREAELASPRGPRPVLLRSWRAPEGGWWVLLRDLTAVRRAEHERRAMELRLLQSQKLEAIGRLAAGVAHEINTPLQFVADNGEFLRESFASLQALLDAYRARATPDPALERVAAACDEEFLRAEVPKALAASAEGVGRVADIVRALKALAHPGGGDPVATRVDSLIADALTLSRNAWKYSAEARIECGPDLPAVRCRPDQIGQVIINLVVNAADAIAEARAGRGGLGTIVVSARRDGEHVELRVADDGPGIPEAARDRLFEPFFTTKPVGKGTGQGLPIARSLVEAHGGTIGFESAAGRGTTFIVRLPV